jgi:hypothetical protein
MFLRRADTCQFAMCDPGLGERSRRRIRFDGFDGSGSRGGNDIAVSRRRGTLMVFSFVEIVSRYIRQIGCVCKEAALGPSSLGGSV